MTSNIINTCRDIIKVTQNIVVLTGAGISTESGIKDFRSRTGIYRHSPEYILSLDFFYQHPKEFYRFAVENLYHPNALPNSGHEILAKWETEKKVSHIITQNIDGLHQSAGSKHVIEFHGTMGTASCLNCGKPYPMEEMLERMNTIDKFYICDKCETKEEQEHYIKPDVVLFGDRGEWFTVEGFSKVTNIIDQADCLLVMGTSLKVNPFASFPQYRKEGVPMILINKGDSPYDDAPDTYVIHDSIGNVLLQMDK